MTANYMTQYETILRAGIAIVNEIEDANIRKEACDGINRRLWIIRNKAEREGFGIIMRQSLSALDRNLLELDARAQYRLIFGEEAA